MSKIILSSLLGGILLGAAFGEVLFRFGMYKYQKMFGRIEVRK